MPNTFKELINEKNKALCELDMVYARDLLPSASCDYSRLASLHKARYECVEIPRELRHESGLWLKENNFKRMTGEEILPEGVLPA